MKRYLQLTLAAALLITVHEAPAAGQAESSSQATPVARCDMRLRVELTPDIANPRDAGVIGSLVTSHPDYQLSLEHSDLENSSIIALSLRGPGPEAGCRDSRWAAYDRRAPYNAKGPCERGLMAI
jgi:hypothetical protein